MSSKHFPVGPLEEIDIAVALMSDKEPDDNCRKIQIPKGATTDSVIDQLAKLGYTATRVKMRTIFFGR